MSAAEADLSAYELERLENIRRNEAKLDALGLSDHRPRQTFARPPTKKRPRPTASEPNALTMEVRRSTRHRTAPEMYSDETPLPETRRTATMRSYEGPYEGPDEPPPVDDADFIDDSEADGRSREPPAVVVRDAPEPGTSRAIKVDVDAVIAKHLGQPMPGPATKDSTVKSLTGGRGARFSKYSGSLEWKNCVVLWVNVGGADYKNVFHADKPDAGAADDPGAPSGRVSGKGKAAAAAVTSEGLTMTWYASPRNDESTPVVARLIKSGGRAGAASSDAQSLPLPSSNGEPILLFCRLPGEPYVCCGRLGYLSHVPRRQPVKFLWRLLDAPKLRGQPAFEELMAAAPS